MTSRKSRKTARTKRTIKKAVLADRQKRSGRQTGQTQLSLVAGRRDRVFGGYSPPTEDANAQVSEDLELVRSRCRDAAVNNPLAVIMRRTMADHTVGSGFVAHTTLDKERLGITDEQAQEWAARCDSYFRENAREADVTGCLEFGPLLRLVYLEMLDGGDLLVSYPRTSVAPGEPKRTRMSIIEAERIATPPKLANDPLVRDGVQRDKWGREVGYWVYRGHPGDPFQSRNHDKYEYWPRYRNGRKNVEHIRSQDRHGRARGLPILTAALALLDQTESYFATTLQTADLQAKMSTFIETAGDPEAYVDGMDARDNEREELGYERFEHGIEAGSINVLASGDKAMHLGMTAPGPYFDVLISRLLRLLSSITGAPYEVMWADTAKANFSSMRQSFEAFRKVLRREQAALLPAAETYRRHILLEGWLAGDLPDFPILDDLDGWLASTWGLPVLGPADAAKEAQYQTAMLEAHLMSPQEIVASTGRDYTEVCQQIAAAKLIREELGIVDAVAEPEPGEEDPAEPDPDDQPDEDQSDDDDDAKDKKDTDDEDQD